MWAFRTSQVLCALKEKTATKIGREHVMAKGDTKFCQWSVGCIYIALFLSCWPLKGLHNTTHIYPLTNTHGYNILVSETTRDATCSPEATTHSHNDGTASLGFSISA